MSLSHAEEQSYEGESSTHPSPNIVEAKTLHRFPELVRELGGNPGALLRRARINPKVLSNPGSVIEYRSLLRVMRYASEALACPDFGLRLAVRQGGNKSIGPIGVVMKNSKTLGQALGYCAKHIHAYSLATRVRFEPDRANQLLLVKLQILLEDMPDKRQAVEHALMLASLNIVELAGPEARVKRILFSHAPLSSLMAYRSYFHCEVLFGQTSDALVLTENDLLRPIADPDECVYEMATSFIEARYPQMETPILARVRHLILKNLSSKNCTSEGIAASLCLHPRTLQRRLRAERTSFEDIRDQIRREVAMRYLYRSDIPLKHVAEKLGYAEASVLTRSCSRWFSATPRELRLKHRSELTTDIDFLTFGGA